MKFTFKHTKLACYGSYMSSAVAINFPPILFIFFHKQFGLSQVDLGALISLNFGVQMLADIIGANTVDKKITYRQAAVTADSLVAAGLLLLGTNGSNTPFYYFAFYFRKQQLVDNQYYLGDNSCVCRTALFKSAYKHSAKRRKKVIN